MTDRVRTLTVILDRDIRDEEESVGVIVNAIKMIRYVSDVLPGDAVGIEQHIATDEYAMKVGRLISELASRPDGNFLSDVLAAYEKLKNKRGY